MGCGHDTRPRSLGSAAASGSGTESSSAPSTVPSAGAPGVGDPYFADLGNGGYDVAHYDLSFTVDPRTNAVEGTAVITATATQALLQFDLDLTGLDVTGLTVDGLRAASSREGRELVVVPAHALAIGSTFTTAVAYRGSPEPRGTKSLPIAVGWIATGDGSYVLNEPEGASTWYPVNDHPIDKATYTFHVTVPDGVTAVANGDLVSQQPTGDGHTTWTYDEKAPMASYLSQVAIGDFVVTTEPGPNGVTIRNVFASSLAKDATVDFSRTTDMLQLFATEFGPYPFDVYGALVVNDRTNYELETQTLSLFDSRFASGSTSGDVLAAHELAHQWFGDSVTPSSWKDIWLNEGFATYAEWLWQEHVGGISVADAAKRAHDSLPPSSDVLTGDPGVEHLFDTLAVYQRGAVALQALRLTVGNDAFFNVLRTYAARFAGTNVTTADFIAVANEVAGRDLHDLFDAWLYKAELPALPS